MSRSSALSKAPGHLRLIGGCYRGRRLRIPPQEGLRPTADRVRETLFNWLAPVIDGARCLDLFAGSGALGFEAASRGAREVVMIERAAPVIRVLRAHRQALEATAVRLVQADALRWLAAPGQPFDIVFLDPPFAADLLAPCLDRIAAGGWLAPRARLYVEAPRARGFPELRPGWRLARDRHAGQVRYGLIETGAPAAPPDA